jgi:hypothetical protein
MSLQQAGIAGGLIGLPEKSGNSTGRWNDFSNSPAIGLELFMRRLGRKFTAMKARARTPVPATHHVAAAAGKSAG